MTNITNLNDRRPGQFLSPPSTPRPPPPRSQLPPLCPPERIDPAAKLEIIQALKYRRHARPLDDYGIRQMERETRIVSRCIYAVTMGLILGACLWCWAHS